MEPQLSRLFFFSNRGKICFCQWINLINIFLASTWYFQRTFTCLNGFLAHDKFLYVLILTNINDHFLKNYDPLTHILQAIAVEFISLTKQATFFSFLLIFAQTCTISWISFSCLSRFKHLKMLAIIFPLRNSICQSLINPK